MIHLEPVTSANQAAVCALAVQHDQESFIWSNRRTLDALSETASPRWRVIPLAIYADAVLVGFMMYTVSASNEWCFIDRLMIDHHHQGLGYGKAALTALIEILQKEAGVREVQVTVHSINRIAKALYHAAGFYYRGPAAGDPSMELLELRFAE